MSDMRTTSSFLVRSPITLSILCFLLAIDSVKAISRSSADYSVPADIASVGGLRATSANYSNDGTAGGVDGISTLVSPSENLKHGYVAQLYEKVGLSITAPPSNNLNEGTSRQLQAAPLLDDTTTLTAFDPSTVNWSVVSGPVSGVSTGGLATAATVYQDTAATVGGSAQNLSGQLTLTILNVNTDDFGSYAGDGIDDSWQVQYFGQNNSNAGPTKDPDGDGQNNLFEWTAGLVPTDPSSRFALSIAAVANQPTQKALTFSPRFSDRTYIVKSKANLSDTSWAALPSSTTNDNGQTRTVVDLSATGSTKFYHVEITKP
jgi:hypothetical protein